MLTGLDIYSATFSSSHVTFDRHSTKQVQTQYVQCSDTTSLFTTSNSTGPTEGFGPLCSAWITFPSIVISTVWNCLPWSNFHLPLVAWLLEIFYFFTPTPLHAFQSIASKSANSVILRWQTQEYPPITDTDHCTCYAVINLLYWTTEKSQNKCFFLPQAWLDQTCSQKIRSCRRLHDAKMGYKKSRPL